MAYASNNPFDAANNPFSPQASKSKPLAQSGGDLASNLAQQALGQQQGSSYSDSAAGNGAPLGANGAANANASTMAPSGASQVGGAIGAGVGALGNYYSGVASAQSQGNAQSNTAAANLADLYLRQQQLAQGGSQAVLNSNSPGSDLAPYAKMALAGALFKGTPDGATTNNIGGQINVPDQLKQYTPTLSGGTSLDPAKQAMGQFFSPNAIISSMQHQAELQTQVDPYTTPMNFGSIYAGTPDEQLANDAMNWVNTRVAPEAQKRQQAYQDPARQALHQALAQSQQQAQSGGGFWHGLLGVLGAVAPFLGGFINKPDKQVPTGGPTDSSQD